MPETARPVGDSNCFELDFLDREATPEPAMKLGIRPHLAGLSLSDTISILDRLCVERGLYVCSSCETTMTQT
jgi:putative transposase